MRPDDRTLARRAVRVQGRRGPLPLDTAGITELSLTLLKAPWCNAATSPGSNPGSERAIHTSGHKEDTRWNRSPDETS
jgi:hypothetical protein